MLALYVISLALSAGITGTFVRDLLHTQGYVPGLRLNMTVTLAVAGLYIALQLGYMALLRLLIPTRSKAPLFTEILSHLGTLVLVPYLAGLQVPWPRPVLFKVEPIIYLAGMMIVHLFFKFATLYGVTRGKPSGRLGALGWLGFTVLAAFCTFKASEDWAVDLAAARPAVISEPTLTAIDNAWAMSCRVQEGAIYEAAASRGDDHALTFRVAGDEYAGTTYFTVECLGDTTKVLRKEMGVLLSDWREVRFTPDELPHGLKTCRIRWSSDKPTPWERILGLSPVLVSDQALHVSGPFQYASSNSRSAPSVVVIAVDGLGVNHMSLFGYERTTTPNLDRFARTAQVFENTFSPAPDADTAFVTLLTGVSPLCHRHYLGAHENTPVVLPGVALPFAQRGYATAAFVDGADGQDIVAAGFDFVDGEGSDDTGDAEQTLSRARSFLDTWSDYSAFVLVRLTELATAPDMVDKDYKTTYGGDTPTPGDKYDNALRHLDTQLGQFIRHIRNQRHGRETHIIFVGLNGSDFSKGPAQQALSEECLHVPLIYYYPEQEPAIQDMIVNLEDLTATCIAGAGARIPQTMTGTPLAEQTAPRAAVSQFGDPLVLSVRTERWRYTWQTAVSADGRQALDAKEGMGLYDMDAWARSGRASNLIDEQPALANRFQTLLESQLALLENTPPASTSAPATE